MIPKRKYLFESIFIHLSFVYIYETGSLFQTNKASLIEYHILFETDTN